MKKILIILGFLLLPAMAFAKADLSLSETALLVSKNDPAPGETVRVYARVFNGGDADVSGFVIFINNGAELGSPQQISVRPGTYDDVFIDWVTTTGNNILQAKITGTIPADENAQNNASAEKSVTVAAAPKPAESQSQAQGENQSSSDTGSQVVTAASEAVQKAQNVIENFTTTNPIKSFIAKINDAVAGAAEKWLHLKLGNLQTETASAEGEKTQSPINLGQWQAAVIGAFAGKNIIWYILGAAAVLAILFILWRRRNRGEY